MKPLRAIAPLLILTMMATAGHADMYQKLGGFLSTVDTITDYTFFGIGLQYEIGYKSTWGAIGGEFRLSYTSYTDDDHDAYGDDEENYSIIPIEAGLKYSKPLGDKWAPYISGGVGLYKFKDDSDFDYDDIVGFHGAIGCEFYLVEAFGLFLQLKYTDATDDLEGHGLGNRYGVEGLGGDAGMIVRF